MTPAQMRAARSLIEWTQKDLADASDVGLSTVVDFEKDRRLVSEDARAEMKHALERAGITFIEENGGGAGVRFTKPSRHAEIAARAGAAARALKARGE